MAKLYLKFGQAVLKEISLAQSALSIGRSPDSDILIENLAISSRHARLYSEHGQYVIEDNNSTNGTYVVRDGVTRRVSREALRDGDQLIIGRHTLVFQEDQPLQAGKDVAGAPAIGAIASAAMVGNHVQIQAPAIQAPGIQVSQQVAAPSASAPAVADTGETKLGHVSPFPGRWTDAAQQTASYRERAGRLTILEGKTDQTQYVLTGKMTVIGKSEMASIRLKGFFAPKMAALISKRDGRFFIAASEQDVKVHVNGAGITGQRELADGDTIEVAGIKATFECSG